jgi:hypothetical protein
VECLFQDTPVKEESISLATADRNASDELRIYRRYTDTSPAHSTI